MAESDFSWFKLASFAGAAILMFACFVVIAGGINLIVGGNAFNGVFTIIAGLVLGAGAVWVYRNYQKNSLGDKIKDDKKKK